VFEAVSGAIGKSSLLLSFKKEVFRGAAKERVLFFFEKKKQKTFAYRVVF
jgi:hypothetical protein